MSTQEKNLHLEILVAARRRITDPAHWTTNTCARDTMGVAVATSNPAAIRWCVQGAIIAECRIRCQHTFHFEVLEVVDTIESRFGIAFSGVNDGPNGHARVLWYLDKAIRQMQAELEGGAT